jgi:Fic family protein
MTTPNAFLPNLEPQQSPEVTRIIGEIDEFKGHWRKLGEIRAERLASLRQVTTIESAGSSTRIEGAQLSDDEVARVLEGLSVDSFRERDQGEVLGYGELLQTIFDNYATIPLSENYLKQLHQILLGHVEKDAWHRGQYKKTDNHVEARHTDGRVEIVFRTASPVATPHLMADLVRATNEVLDAGALHPLFAIARFVVEFLAIHPFQDGNGRLSRALTALLLLRSGYAYVPYASVERVIEDNKLEYYRALRVSQTAMGDDPARFGEWLVFFLLVLRTQTRTLAAKLEIERSVIRLTDVQQRVLDVIERHGRATTPEIARHLEMPDRSVRYHLSMLASRGLIAAHGERKGRYYTRATSAGPSPAGGAESRNGAILAAILERGGSVTRDELIALLDGLGLDHRMAGALHGRRLAHLRKDPKTGKSVLTTRGRELAEQYLFAARLSRRVERT